MEDEKLAYVRQARLKERVAYWRSSLGGTAI